VDVQPTFVRRHAAAGVVLTAFAFGLRSALEGLGVKPAIVQEADDDFFGPLKPIELHLECSPEDSWVVLRPWLLRGSDTN
jgi:hypothetical protein